jgi:V/A-type H+-transporting ATPase subunit E
MPLDRIREAILSEARREAESIESEARARHDERMKAAAAELDDEFNRRLQAAKEHARQECERKVSQSRSQHNLALLKLRNAALDDVFRAAAEQLVKMPDDSYRAFVLARLKNAPEDVGGELLCAVRDEARLRPVVEELNRTRREDARLKLVAGDRPALGGVILRTGKFELDLSLDSLVERLRQELAPAVAGMLFPPDATV